MDAQKLEQLKELARIIKDTPYALRTYLKTFDKTQNSYVPFNLFDEQIVLIHDLEKYNENITRKYRQAGVSSVTAAWVSKKLVVASEDSPEKVLIVGNKRETAVQFAEKVKGYLKQWPSWINVGINPDRNSESRYILNNGSEVRAVATSSDALRNYTPTILIFDEAAFITAGEDFWASSMASLGTGGKVIMISTPNGHDPIYYGIYDQAVKGLNDFHITNLTWYNDPRYAKDLKWIKCDDIVHYMRNRTEYNDDEVVLKNVDVTKYQEYEESGYKPYSSWFEKMSKKFKWDRRKIAQELECDFLGSGDGVIPKDVRENIRRNMIHIPKETYMNSSLWQWKEPIQGHKYIMGVDVSRGDSEDFSSINIVDFDDREQVVEYIGKIPPDDLALIAYKWGILYDAYIVIDITGGMGVATSRKLQELGYKSLYIDKINTQNVWEYDKKALEKIPGINFNNKRTQIIAAFEEQLRKGFIVRSERLLHEIDTFVYINGRPDHQKNAHDDAIMSMSMALYVGDVCFTQLLRNDSQNKAMIEAWTLSERTYDPQKSFYSYGAAFDQISSISTGNNPYQPQQPNAIKEQYKEYSWLFSKSIRR